MPAQRQRADYEMSCALTCGHALGLVYFAIDVPSPSPASGSEVERASGKRRRRRENVSQRSGFVPIRFRVAGKLLLILGAIGLVLVGIAQLSGWFALPSLVWIASLAMLVVGLYLIWVGRREREDQP
jgi:hypothetical protein